MRLRLTIVALMLALAVPALGQNEDGRWSAGLDFGVWKLIHGDRDYSNVDQFAAMHVRYGLTPRWSLGVGFKYGWTRPGVTEPGEDAGLTFDSGAGLYTRIWQPSLEAVYHLNDGATWRPWLSVGAGWTRWDVRDLRGEDSVGLWPDGEASRVYDEDGNWVGGHDGHLTALVGAGLTFMASDHWSFDLGARYDYLFGSDRDNVGMSRFWGADHVDANSAIVQGFVGVRFTFGSSDDDGDGIKNSQDACPQQAEDFDGYEDLDGCPDLDNDGDGIADVQDQCPEDAEDVDGYQDADGCPDPDNDGDGIADAQDQCPDEAEDIDGFQDEDGCPDPDNDGDGVPDERDECPRTPAGIEVTEDGCPVVAEIREDLVLEGVTFKLGSAELTPNSITILRDVVESLKAWPEVTVEVAGYTDSSGPEDLNQRLSQERAESVRQFLIQQGIDPDRITAVGYGEANPVADNATREGREQNRRVELHRTDK